jgi:hypothetical protein
MKLSKKNLEVSFFIIIFVIDLKNILIMDLPKYENSKVTHEQTVELHKLLVQTVIDFLKKENIDEVWEVQFSADGLTDSVKHGEWTPSTDSYIGLIGTQQMGTMKHPKNGEEYPLMVRALIDESM